jgi:hypothetical protein
LKSMRPKYWRKAWIRHGEKAMEKLGISQIDE